jgi:uncharacterized protein YndB with AHSA1/START domain
MAVSFTIETTFAVPQERAFAALTDLERAEEWMPGLVGIERLTDGGFGQGTEWAETRKIFGKEATEIFTVTDYLPPQRLALLVDGTRGTSGKGEYRFTYELGPADGGKTEVFMKGEIDMPGFFAGLLTRLFSGWFKKACAKDLYALRDHLAEEG